MAKEMLLEFGVMNRNKRIYPIELEEQILNDLKERKAIPVKSSYKEETLPFIGTATNFEISDHKLYGEIKLTESYKCLVEELAKSEMPVHFRTSGNGSDR